ncbi:MAG: autotransporter domain-containing protein [Caulobacteraceae bacterium]
MKRSLIAAAALAPLVIAAAGTARAETVISTSVTTPVVTSKANSGAADDVKIASGGNASTTSAGAIVTVDSNNTFRNEGTVAANNTDGVIGVQVNGGLKGAVTNAGIISILEDYTATDTDSDGDIDGPFAKGSNRIGIRLSGAGVYDGSINNIIGGSITVEGNTSYGVLLENGLTGNVFTPGSITVFGDKSVGLDVKGDVSGNVRVGAVNVVGDGSSAVIVDANVTGGVNIGGAVSSTGYRYTTRPSTKAVITALDSDDLLQGGAAVRISGDVGKGLILSAPPADNDTKNDDEDGDGVPDASQGTGTIAQRGGAPALQIGALGKSVTFGTVGTGTSAYGVINQGTILADGVYDNVASTAIDIGLDGGGAVTITGGIRNAGSILSNAYEANATGISIGDGANAGVFVNESIISAVSTTAGANQARAIDIAATGTLTKIDNTGTLSSGVNGSLADARTIVDASGTLTAITNTGIIQAVITPSSTVAQTGVAVAVDASANTTGLSITQTQSAVKDAAAPTLKGAIIFGSGADTLDLEAGTATGTVLFGAGADVLKIDGGANLTGAIGDSGGDLAITVNKGTLQVLNAQTIGITSLNLGAESSLIVAADPQNANPSLRVTRFEATTANITTGAQIGLSLQSLLLDPTKFTVVKAGTLTSGTLSQTLLQNAPFLYVAQASADTKLGEVYLDVRRRTTAELGFRTAQSQAYDAVFDALKYDSGIQGALLSKTDAAGLTEVYDQLLPDQGEGVFSALDNTSQLMANMVDARPDPEQRIGGDSVWLQEVNGRVSRETTSTLGSEVKAFGLIGGYESMASTGSAYGVTLGFVSAQDDDDVAAVGEHVVASILEAGAYARYTPGNWRFTVRGAGGVVWLNSTRRFVTTGVQREAQADWSGVFASGHVGAAYEAKWGRFYARPELSLDYIYLSEGDRTETGGGDGFNLEVSQRKSDRLTGSAIMVVGAQFGRTSWLRTEFRAGYRSIISGEVGSTTARFINATGTPFTLTPDNSNSGYVVLGFSLRGGTELSYVAVEGDAELGDGEQRFNVRLAGRAMF